MTYRFALCDDEPTELAFLERIVLRWADTNSFAVSISGYSSAEAFLFQYAEDKTFDILLLDIEMGKMSGVELARKVRAENKAIQIVFITGYMEYIADGYEVEALHYLIKHVTERKLLEVLDRAAEKLGHNEKALILNLGAESVRVPLYKIRYLEVQRNYVTVHAAEDYTLKSTLGLLEKELDNRFFRVGRSYIVNLRFIKRITKTEIFLSDGSIIPLPRGQYEAINRTIIDRM